MNFRRHNRRGASQKTQTRGSEPVGIPRERSSATAAEMRISGTETEARSGGEGEPKKNNNDKQRRRRAEAVSEEVCPDKKYTERWTSCCSYQEDAAIEERRGCPTKKVAVTTVLFGDDRAEICRPHLFQFSSRQRLETLLLRTPVGHSFCDSGEVKRCSSYYDDERKRLAVPYIHADCPVSMYGGVATGGVCQGRKETVVAYSTYMHASLPSTQNMQSARKFLLVYLSSFILGIPRTNIKIKGDKVDSPAKQNMEPPCLPRKRT